MEGASFKMIGTMWVPIDFSASLEQEVRDLLRHLNEEVYDDEER